MKPDYFLLISILMLGMYFSVSTKKLTVGASLTGGIIGLLLFAGIGYGGLLTMASFFIIAVIATAWKLKEKVLAGLSETNKGRRSAFQVLANAGVPAFIAIFAFFYPSNQFMWEVMLASSFAAATSDTVSSELGNVYGKNYYHIITWKKDLRGENGVVSLEGTLAGIAGSTFISLIYAVCFGFSAYVFLILIAGFLGNIVDSILGATLERRFILNNNMVNFLNTLFAALIAGVFLYN
ncbi:DUF92 domain-containing protein [Arcticibacter svalbardensis]|nr:DUF92 domain-containing protein [Arcticibacter svalbardensis]